MTEYGSRLRQYGRDMRFQNEISETHQIKQREMEQSFIYPQGPIHSFVRHLYNNLGLSGAKASPFGVHSAFPLVILPGAGLGWYRRRLCGGDWTKSEKFKRL